MYVAEIVDNSSAVAAVSVAVVGCCARCGVVGASSDVGVYQSG